MSESDTLPNQLRAIAVRGDTSDEDERVLRRAADELADGKRPRGFWWEQCARMAADVVTAWNWVTYARDAIARRDRALEIILERCAREHADEHNDYGDVGESMEIIESAARSVLDPDTSHSALVREILKRCAHALRLADDRVSQYDGCGVCTKSAIGCDMASEGKADAQVCPGALARRALR